MVSKSMNISQINNRSYAEDNSRINILSPYKAINNNVSEIRSEDSEQNNRSSIYLWKKARELILTLSVINYMDKLVTIRVISGRNEPQEPHAEKLTKRRKSRHIKFHIISFLYDMKSYWDSLVAILLNYYIFIIPIRLAFNFTDNLLVFEIFLDIIFFLDSLYCFRINLKSMMDEDIAVKSTVKELIQSSAIIWLMISLTASIPFEYIDYSLMYVKIFLRFPDFPRLFELLDKLSALIIMYFPRSLPIVSMISVLFKSVLIFMTLAHICACLWINIGTYDPQNSWMTNSAYNDKYNLNDNEATTSLELIVYLTSLIFAVDTFSTVGYGDIGGNAGNSNEY